MSSPASAAESQLEPGQVVRLPSGSFAEIVAIFPAKDEALVEYPNGETASLRLCHLKPLPGK